MRKFTIITLILCLVFAFGLAGCSKEEKFDEKAYNEIFDELQSRASIIGAHVHQVGDVVKGEDLVELSEAYKDTENLKVNIEMDRKSYDQLPTEEVGTYEVGLGIMFPDGKLWVQQYQYTVLGGDLKDVVNN